MTQTTLRANHDEIVALIATCETTAAAEDAVEEQFGIGILLLAEKKAGDSLVKLATGVEYAIIYAD